MDLFQNIIHVLRIRDVADEVVRETTHITHVGCRPEVAIHFKSRLLLQRKKYFCQCYGQHEAGVDCWNEMIPKAGSFTMTLVHILILESADKPGPWMADNGELEVGGVIENLPNARFLRRRGLFVSWMSEEQAILDIALNLMKECSPVLYFLGKEGVWQMSL